VTDDTDGSDDPGTLALTPDELAGIADLFGGLTRTEFEEALAELAFRHGADPPSNDRLDDALDGYVLVTFEHDDGDLLVPGPTAFPTMPDGAEDLPHILDIATRDIDRAALGEAVERRFRAEAARAVADEDANLVAQLLDVSYDLEAWAPVELGAVRDRLDAARE